MFHFIQTNKNHQTTTYMYQICIKYVSNMYQIYRSYISKTTATSFAKWWPTWRSCLGGPFMDPRDWMANRISDSSSAQFLPQAWPIPSRIRNTTQNDYCSPLKWIDPILNHDLVWGVFDIIGKGLLYISFPESQPLATGHWLWVPNGTHKFFTTPNGIVLPGMFSNRNFMVVW